MAVFDDARKRRWRRLIRRQRQTAGELGQQADDKIEKLLLRRLDRLISVRRFVSLWTMLVFLLLASIIFQVRALSPHYQILRPVSGGLFSEGLVGKFTNANPIYATGTADSAVSRLLFPGLLKHNRHNRLVGDLASRWRVSKDKLTYVVDLKRTVKWHDGQPLTANDVVFTYKTIQNGQAQSPLRPGWRGINVKKSGNYQVSFNLPDAFTPFPHSLTNGIVPAHLLDNIEPAKLRTSDFNIKPVGAGPFAWQFVEVSGISAASRQQRIGLTANDDYFGGRPKLDGFSIIVFADEQQMINVFANKQLNAISNVESLPDKLLEDNEIQVYPTHLNSIVMAFFNNSITPLGDRTVRRALVQAVDTKRLINLFDYPTNLADAPLLRGQLGYDRHAGQFPYNPKAAKNLLQQTGWRVEASGQRFRAKLPLQMTMRTQDNPDYAKVAQFLQDQWRKIGAKVDVRYYSADDLQSQIIANHDYDILLYGISIGVDPDIFAYWHSSQASISSQGHLNLSEYQSTIADQALASARTRTQDKARATKYERFLRVWRTDAPALALYQPNLLYVSRGPIFNFERRADTDSADRFYNVQNWMIRQARQTK
ncbi:hypothetical protein HY380_00180 [Candidatus Saccharibacteria bacterium]|nr:hypothetical protein [Candidatus Saccharibacteria bacterium]